MVISYLLAVYHNDEQKNLPEKKLLKFTGNKLLLNLNINSHICNILSGDFRFSAENKCPSRLRFRFVLSRKWNFIFVGIFVYGRNECFSVNL